MLTASSINTRRPRVSKPPPDACSMSLELEWCRGGAGANTHLSPRLWGLSSALLANFLCGTVFLWWWLEYLPPAAKAPAALTQPFNASLACDTDLKCVHVELKARSRKADHVPRAGFTRAETRTPRHTSCKTKTRFFYFFLFLLKAFEQTVRRILQKLDTAIHARTRTNADSQGFQDRVCLYVFPGKQMSGDSFIRPSTSEKKRHLLYSAATPLPMVIGAVWGLAALTLTDCH